jgi:transposase
MERAGNAWLVPSQSRQDLRYAVQKVNGVWICSCPDHTERGVMCKHAWAVSIRYTMTRVDQDENGNTTVSTVEVKAERRTYPQKWAEYNRAATTEGARFPVLLHDLCKDLADPVRPPTRGPKPHRVCDSIFSMVYKVYRGFSSRRFHSDLQEAFDRGFTTRPIPGMKVTSFHENPDFTPILTELVSKSAAPLAAIEQDFAIDSSGFSSDRKSGTWREEKHGEVKRCVLWVKAHATCGVKTGIVTAVQVLESNSADSPQFKGLVEKTAETFAINEVSADLAYPSYDNFDTVAMAGGTLYTPFKTGTTGKLGGLFAKMFHLFQFQKEEYLAHYHKRSNVEAVFSAVKRVFGESVLSRTETAMKNEVLCKIIAHNIRCLIHEQEELGIAPIFWKDGCNAITNGATQLAV